MARTAGAVELLAVSLGPTSSFTCEVGTATSDAGSTGAHDCGSKSLSCALAPAAECEAMDDALEALAAVAGALVEGFASVTVAGALGQGIASVAVAGALMEAVALVASVLGKGTPASRAELSADCRETVGNMRTESAAVVCRAIGAAAVAVTASGRGGSFGCAATRGCAAAATRRGAALEAELQAAPAALTAGAAAASSGAAAAASAEAVSAAAGGAVPSSLA